MVLLTSQPCRDKCQLCQDLHISMKRAWCNALSIVPAWEPPGPLAHCPRRPLSPLCAASQPCFMCAQSCSQRLISRPPCVLYALFLRHCFSLVLLPVNPPLMPRVWVPPSPSSLPESEIIHRLGTNCSYLWYWFCLPIVFSWHGFLGIVCKWKWLQGLSGRLKNALRESCWFHAFTIPFESSSDQLHH